MKPNKCTIDSAAEEGHLNMIKYLYNKGLSVTKDCMNKMTYNENIEILNYLKSLGLEAEESSESI
jgi:hypothetical protein